MTAGKLDSKIFCMSLRGGVEDAGVVQPIFDDGALGTVACTTSMWPGHFRTLTLADSGGQPRAPD